jgi:hypothetical protein
MRPDLERQVFRLLANTPDAALAALIDQLGRHVKKEPGCVLIRREFDDGEDGVCLLELVARHHPDFAADAAPGLGLSEHLDVGGIISAWDSGSRKFAAELLRMLRRERFYSRARPARVRRRMHEVSR